MSCPVFARYLMAGILSLGCCLPVQAASMAVADASGGYAGKVLQKVVDVWAVPATSATARGEHSVAIRVGLDDKGRVVECGPTRKSGLDALDASACAAVRKAAPFGIPPYAIPIEIHLTFWTGQPRGTNALTNVPAIQPAPVSSLSRPGNSEELARQRAADIARESAQTTPASGLSKEEMQLGSPANTAGAAQDERIRKYLSRVSWALRQAIAIPAEIRPGTYYATVRLRLASDGTIREQTMVQGSGEAQLDKYVLRGVRRAGKVEAPPRGLPPQVDITFTLVR